MHRRDLLTLLSVGGAGLLLGCTRQTPPARDALRRGAAFLLSQQTAEGAFPSAHYGFMSLGQSTTPLALQALLALPSDAAPGDRAPLRRALAWMLARRDVDGPLGFAAPAPDYPVYATSLMLSCLAALEPKEASTLAAPSVAWLRGQQLVAARGFEGSGVGGFPMGARAAPEPGRAQHVDLSMTQRAVSALVALGAGKDDPALQAARGFVARCAAPNGGFIYSPVEAIVNKGVRAAGAAPTGEGYGSATADGVTALDACGAAGTPLHAAGLAWLHANHRADANPGVGDGPYAAYGEAMRFYYRAAVAPVFHAHGGPEGWREGLIAAVIAEQRDDGAWANASALQKEDDPIIATSLALRALSFAVG